MPCCYNEPVKWPIWSAGSPFSNPEDLSMNKPHAFSLTDAWAVLETQGWLARREPQVRSKLFSIARLREFSAGESIFLAGDTPDGIYGLVRGALQVGFPRVDGQEFLVHRAEVGFWIGDVAVFSTQKRLVSLRAVEECFIVHLRQNSLAKLIDDKPDLIRDFYELTHNNTRTTLELLGNLSITSADQRIALRLLMHAETLRDKGDWIHVSQDTLGQMVALSLKTVRRALQQLEDRALIQSAYAKVRITDREGLARLCGYSLPS